MRKEDVPQDKELFGEQREVSYAVDENGRYVLAPCAGWEPANYANRLAWQEIKERTEQALEGVRAGRLSPLAVYMELNQMDAWLLSRYAKISWFTVRSHLKPKGFAKMTDDEARRYAEVLRADVKKLREVPQSEVLLKDLGK